MAASEGALGMGSVIQHVGNPLQLVALMLLLIAGVARLLVRTGEWKPSAATSRFIVNRVFVAAIVALILGLGAPALAPSIDALLSSGDEIFRGAVTSSAGDVVANATVNVLGVAVAQTNPAGQFEISVPRSHALSSYSVQVTAAGFKTFAVQVLSEADMRNLKVILEPVPETLVQGLGSYMPVGQFYGSPIILASLQVDNGGQSAASITDVRGVLSGPSTSFTLLVASTSRSAEFGPFQMAFGPVAFDPGNRLDLHMVLTVSVNYAAMFRAITQLPEYRGMQPCYPGPDGYVAPMTDAAFDLANKFASEKFAWRPGAWHLTLDVVAAGIQQTYRKDFTLTSDDVDGLRKSFALLKQCQSVNLSAPFAQDGALANFVSK